MALIVKPQTALKFIKVSVYLACSWPPPVSASYAQRIWFSVRWWITFIFLILLFLPLVKGVYTFHSDTLVLIKAICLCSATAQAVIKVVFCRVQRSRLQALLMEVEHFIKNANPTEAQYIQNYVNKTAGFHAFIIISIYLVCFAFIVEPIIVSRPFPAETSYPFPVDNKVIHMTLYVQQCVSIFLVASALSVDCQVAALLWFIGARFEIIGEQFEQASNGAELAVCVRGHQYILWYAKEVHYAVRYIALGTIGTTTIGVICGCLTILSSQPLSVKIRMGNIVGNAVTELFVYSWPADNLIQASQAIGDKVFNCRWSGKSCSMMTTVMGVINRSQKPSVISINGFIPSLSLHYYTTFLSRTFSYFTTLRIILSSKAT